MLHVGDSSYIGNPETVPINNHMDQLPLSEPWKNFSTSHFAQNEDTSNNNKYTDIPLKETASTKLQDNEHELFPDDFDDEKYYSDSLDSLDSSSEVDSYIDEPKPKFEYQYFYLFGFLLLVLSIGFLYWENCILDVPKSEELNLTVAYVLEKKF
jgi:hypothetical protein